MSAWEAYKQTMVVPSSLWSAAKRNDVPELARLLADGAPLEERDARGYSPLMFAAYCGSVEAFDYLLAQVADLNSRDLAGNPVLMGAAFKGHAYMMSKLLTSGADASLRNDAGLDAAAFATTFGRQEIVALVRGAAQTAQDARMTG